MQSKIKISWQIKSSYKNKLPAPPVNLLPAPASRQQKIRMPTIDKTTSARQEQNYERPPTTDLRALFINKLKRTRQQTNLSHQFLLKLKASRTNKDAIKVKQHFQVPQQPRKQLR